MMKKKKTTRRLLTLFMWASMVLTMAQCSGGKGDMTGIMNGKLTPCPDSPNCVSSQSEDDSHFVAPFAYTGPLQTARQKLLEVLTTMDRTEVVTKTDHYIHVTFTSRIFRFVDDVEFFFADDKPVIHVRSASRVGYSDLGVNRKRVEKIRKAFSEDA
jgi:uncharacterized protein (DUF1499 family)